MPLFRASIECAIVELLAIALQYTTHYEVVGLDILLLRSFDQQPVALLEVEPMHLLSVDVDAVARLGYDVSKAITRD